MKWWRATQRPIVLRLIRAPWPGAGAPCLAARCVGPPALVFQPLAPLGHAVRVISGSRNDARQPMPGSTSAAA